MVVSGTSTNDCNRFPLYITLIATSNTIASTARTGDTLLTLRSVDPADKSFAMGLMGSIFAIFAFIPYPLIFGAIIDSTCMIWEKSCGKTGNCWLYDMDKYRVYMHLSAFTFLMIGVLFEIGTVVYAGQITNLYEEDDEDGQEMKDVENTNGRASEGESSSNNFDQNLDENSDQIKTIGNNSDFNKNTHPK